MVIHDNIFADSWFLGLLNPPKICILLQKCRDQGEKYCQITAMRPRAITPMSREYSNKRRVMFWTRSVLTQVIPPGPEVGYPQFSEWQTCFFFYNVCLILFGAYRSSRIIARSNQVTKSSGYANVIWCTVNLLEEWPQESHPVARPKFALITHKWVGRLKTHVPSNMEFNIMCWPKLIFHKDSFWFLISDKKTHTQLNEFPC